MQAVIQEVRQALQQGRFETCKSVIGETLCAADDHTDRLVLLELLAEAHAGLDDPVAAAHTWEQAYHQSPLSTDRARLFEQACQSYEQAQNLSALERLAQVHSRCANTSHERAKSLLVAGEALMRQRQYRKARERYFKPGLDCTDIRPEMRAYLWYDVGLCYLTEQEFAAAAEAFRISLSIPLAVRLPTQLPTSPAHLISVQQLQNAAHFYSGIIHLMHHQVDQAVRAIKKVQPSPRTGAKFERANTQLPLHLATIPIREAAV
jgi:tetratricopeptide (TPR) repeat protein